MNKITLNTGGKVSSGDLLRNPEGNRFAIVCQYCDGLVAYDLENGKFLKETATGEDMLTIMNKNGYFLLCANESITLKKDITKES